MPTTWFPGRVRERFSGTRFGPVTTGGSRPLIAVAALVAVAAAGCSDDGHSATASNSVATPATAESPPNVSGPVLDADADAVAADQICTALKAQANVMTAVANDAVRSINSLSPQERVAALTAGFDAATTAVGDFADGLATIDVEAIAERDAILLEIAAGAQAALDELADERARFSEQAGSAISDEQVQGSVGQFFNSIEKVNSLVEPVIGRYERIELQRAFLEAEPCEHVIQPFRIDE